MRKKFLLSVMLLVTMLTTLLFGNNVRADYYDDFYDNEYDYEYSDADDLEIDYKSLSLNEGSTQKIDYVFVGDAIVWNSMDTDIATVSQDGTVTGVSEGETYVVAHYGNYSKKVKIVVVKKLNYFEIAREMKKYAQKHPKEAKFKNIDVGTCCRLYGTDAAGTYKKKIESAGWGSATFYKNYIELTRKKGVTKIAYYVYGEVRFLSIYDYTELSPQKMKLRTSHRRLNFSLDLVNSKDKYSKGVYTSIAKVSSELSSNENINYDKFSKYEKMLTQRKLSINFSFYNDTFTESNMPKKTKNSWYKLTDFYENIIFG